MVKKIQKLFLSKFKKEVKVKVEKILHYGLEIMGNYSEFSERDAIEKENAIEKAKADAKAIEEAKPRARVKKTHYEGFEIVGNFSKLSEKVEEFKSTTIGIYKAIELEELIPEDVFVENMSIGETYIPEDYNPNLSDDDYADIALTNSDESEEIYF